MVVNMEYKALLFGPKHGSKLFLPSPNNLFPVRKLSCLPLTPFPINKPSRFVRLKATTRDDQENNRKFKILLPSPWTDYIHSLSVDVSEMDALRKEIDVLKPKVKKALMSSQVIDSTKKRILLIYLLVSLLLAHHFEDEIHETLEEGFEKIEEIMDGEDDLYTVSIIFWVFRRYGHHFSSDVFRRFKRNDGNFKESLVGDAKGMLSLYEAANLRTTKDYILDEALSFSSRHLESLAASGTCMPHISIRIRSALYQSQNWNMDMIVPLDYISFYEQEKDHDEMLLKFSKINLKLLQLQYREELKIVTKWYKEELDFASKFPAYFRDRIVENYFFAKAVFFEPQLSRGRILFTKLFTALGILDDTFDRYVSLPEAECLANSLERWAPDHDMDNQPVYLKFALKPMFDIFEEFEREFKPEGRSYSVDATKEELKKVAKAQIELLKWVDEGHVPYFEEYMEVGEVEFTLSLCISAILMFMLATREDFEWFKSTPKLLKCLCVQGRILNDMAGFEDDMSRGYVTNAVNCYMKEYGVTKKEAFKELNKILEENDKILNEEVLTTNCVPRSVLKAIMDFARMNAVMYNGLNDGYTNPQVKINQYQTSMYVDLIHL